MADPLVFIPPSETKQPGGEPSFLHGHGKYRELASRRERVLAALEKAMKGTIAQREAVLKVKGDALAEATEKNLAVRSASLTRPAIERYSGVLYDHLRWSELPEPARRRLNDAVVVVDGLYGLLAPQDEIPDYKLSIDATLPDVGNLREFWRDPIGVQLAPVKGKRPFWDFLPQAHRAALPKEFEFELSVDFVEVVNGQPRSVSHANKALKGAMLHHLARTGLTRENVEAFAHDGFTLDRERSTPRELVFSKAVEAPPEPAKPAKATKGAKNPKGAKASKSPAKKAKAAKAAKGAKPVKKAAAKKPAKKAAKKTARKKAS